jgi:mannose-6-phosphate isomerase-like protein (cupin superfamily)
MTFRPFLQKNVFIKMNKSLRNFAIFFILLFSQAAFAVEQKVLLQGNSSWDGVDSTYNSKLLETLSIYLKIAPGEVLPYHCHPVPSFGYIISGELEVEKKDGTKKTFKKGDSLVEVINTWHRGTNLSKVDPVEIVVFYIGAKSKKDVTILYNESNQTKCSN